MRAREREDKERGGGGGGWQSKDKRVTDLFFFGLLGISLTSDEITTLRST